MAIPSACPSALAARTAYRHWISDASRQDGEALEQWLSALGMWELQVSGERGFCANFRNSQTGRHWPLYAAGPAIAAGAVFELALTR
jgi:hypothetical protein